MSYDLINYDLIEVRHTGQGGAYGEPMTSDDIPAMVQDEIAEQILRDDADSGECEAGGQKYVWRKVD